MDWEQNGGEMELKAAACLLFIPVLSGQARQASSFPFRCDSSFFV